jgi:hypothetical protein
MSESDFREQQNTAKEKDEAKAKTFEERESETKAILLKQANRVTSARDKDREFHGLEREFFYAQAQILVDYEKSKNIKHPRDLGNAREAILGKFLAESGFIPKRYSISNTSVRVAATSGFISKEIDVLLFDGQNAPVLMKRENVYEVYAIEACYGVIQVKSKLTKNELTKAFDNVASFKRLKKVGVQSTSHERGFGIIFAYDTDLEWMEIVANIKELASNTPRVLLPNLIIVLNKGVFLFREGSSGKFLNSEIEIIQELEIFGSPDRQSQCLFSFYVYLTSLLEDCQILTTPITQYFRLPLTAEEISYEFSLGLFAELGACKQHGDYLRKISRESLEKISHIAVQRSLWVYGTP